ncbi:MAG: ribosome silencing factor [Elusimicrobiota bacterium]|jgi:ribosome-associated protein|nr:ribosome silencing factor [Elusimicrobiota bacterium]
MNKTDFYSLALCAASIADDKKALNTIVLDVKDMTDFTNYLVITTGESSAQINAIADETEKRFKEMDIMPLRREGRSSAHWKVLDYGGIMIHIMSPEVRKTYDLESFWKEAQNIIPVEEEEIKVLEEIEQEKIEAVDLQAFEKKVLTENKNKVNTKIKNRKIKMKNKTVKKSTNKIKTKTKPKKKVKVKAKTKTKTIKKNIDKAKIKSKPAKKAKLKTKTKVKVAGRRR